MRSASTSSRQDAGEVPGGLRRTEPASPSHPETSNPVDSGALRTVFTNAVEGVLWIGIRSVTAVQTVLVAVLFHDEFGRTEDS
jgi:hypothetical protein